MHLTGGCLCGAIRYEVLYEADAVVDYCHCRQCQLASGAPVIAWMQVPPAAFRVVRGSAAGYAWSPTAKRWFCAACGSPLYMTDADGRSVGVTLGSLDNPEAVPPTVHGWESERIGWFHVADELPRYEQAPPYDL
jgi:hypothetical protein